jgi:SAM-dependent methyltransferase
VQLSQKIVRPFTPRGRQSFLHAIHRWFHPISLKRVKAGMNLAGLDKVRERHGVPGERTLYPKYLDVDRFLKMNIRRAQDLRLNLGAPLRVLDLGSGGGYFLTVCRFLGHGGIGIDLDEPAMYGEMFEAFGLKRVIWRIEAFQPLPSLGERFDLITAFSIAFNGHKREGRWGMPEWEFLLNDLRRNLLKPGGRIYLDLNPEHDGSFMTPTLHGYFLDQGASIDRSKVLLQT